MVALIQLYSERLLDERLETNFLGRRQSHRRRYSVALQMAIARAVVAAALVLTDATGHGG